VLAIWGAPKTLKKPAAANRRLAQRSGPGSWSSPPKLFACSGSSHGAGPIRAMRATSKSPRRPPRASTRVSTKATVLWQGTSPHEGILSASAEAMATGGAVVCTERNGKNRRLLRRRRETLPDVRPTRTRSAKGARARGSRTELRERLGELRRRDDRGGAALLYGVGTADRWDLRSGSSRSWLGPSKALVRSRLSSPYERPASRGDNCRCWPASAARGPVRSRPGRGVVESPEQLLATCGCSFDQRKCSSKFRRAQ